MPDWTAVDKTCCASGEYTMGLTHMMLYRMIRFRMIGGTQREADDYGGSAEYDENTSREVISTEFKT